MHKTNNLVRKVKPKDGGHCQQYTASSELLLSKEIRYNFQCSFLSLKDKLSATSYKLPYLPYYFSHLQSIHLICNLKMTATVRGLELSHFILMIYRMCTP